MQSNVNSTPGTMNSLNSLNTLNIDALADFFIYTNSMSLDALRDFDSALDEIQQYDDTIELMDVLRTIFDDLGQSELDQATEESFNTSQNLQRGEYLLKVSSQRYSSLSPEIQKNSLLCPICIEDYDKDSFISIISCNHIYHTDCIKEWCKYKQECAVCRKKVDEP